jgi:hypothetical protein
LKPPRNNCLLPGVLVLCNIAQVAENGVSLSDSWRRLVERDWPIRDVYLRRKPGLAIQRLGSRLHKFQEGLESPVGL